MKSITTMLKQLRKKYPEGDHSITKNYRFYTEDSKVNIDYSLNYDFTVQKNTCHVNLTYPELVKTVNKILK